MDAQGRTTSECRSVRAALAGRQDRLRRLAASDESVTGSVLATEVRGTRAPGLDEKTCALVRLAALVASDAPPASYQRSIGFALAAGATVDEVFGTLIAVAPTVGLARLVTATPGVALAAGYDIDSALESLDDQVSRPCPPSGR
jgi:alkylhydroperoxidase/carboxymuconolactone decarboxylase family protein YurZ